MVLDAVQHDIGKPPLLRVPRARVHLLDADVADLLDDRHLAVLADREVDKLLGKVKLVLDLGS